MVQAGRRRHGLQPHEFEPVLSAVKLRIFHLVEKRENFPEAEALFKILWRFNTNRVGPLSYPRKVNWQHISYCLNGPMSPIPGFMNIVLEGVP